MNHPLHQHMDGYALPRGCTSCDFKSLCGGTEGQPEFWGCFSNCLGNCRLEECDYVCPRKWDEFCASLAETNAIDPSAHDAATNRIPEELPSFIPTIFHGCLRCRPLNVAAAAIPLGRLVRYSNGASAALPLRDTDQIRQHFRLAPHTHIVVLGSGPDSSIERFWQHHRHDRLIDALGRLGAALVTSPNYSFFKDAPRTHTLHNFRRIAQVTDLLGSSGAEVAPHLNAQTRHDWLNWRAYLLERPGIRFVAKEFQTGLRNRETGRAHIRQLADLQEAISRPLRVIAIGGAQFASDLDRHFPSCTIVSATPFLKTCHRHRALLGPLNRADDWVADHTLPGEPLDGLLEHNIVRYAAALHRRRSASNTLPANSRATGPATTGRHGHPNRQTSLFSSLRSSGSPTGNPQGRRLPTTALASTSTS